MVGEWQSTTWVAAGFLGVSSEGCPLGKEQKGWACDLDSTKWLSFHRPLGRLVGDKAIWMYVVDVAVVMSKQEDGSYLSKQVNCM